MFEVYGKVGTWESVLVPVASDLVDGGGGKGRARELGERKVEGAEVVEALDSWPPEDE